MPNIELDLPAGEFDQHNLDCYETIRIAEQAEIVWVEIEIEPPKMVGFFEEREVVESVAENSPQIQGSMEDYTQTVESLEEFLITVLDSVYTFSIGENTIQMTRPFERYEDGKRWADEIENRLPRFQSRVSLKVYDDGLPEQSLEELKSQRESGREFEVG